MKEDSAIATTPALRLAFLRAVESYRPDQERLFDDRFSRGLMPGLWQVFLVPGLRHALVALTEQVGPGLIGSLYCRTRYIDDALCDALGAGFDARAYRITCGTIGDDQSPPTAGSSDVDYMDVKKTSWKIGAANELPDQGEFPESNLNLYS